MSFVEEKQKEYYDLIKQAANLDIRTCDGRALLKAIKENRISTLNAFFAGIVFSRLDLLEYNQQEWEQGIIVYMDYLVFTIIFGDHEVFKWLVKLAKTNCYQKLGDDFWYRCLNCAVFHGHLEIVGWILKEHPAVKIDKPLFEKSLKNTERHANIACLLLELGSNIDSDVYEIVRSFIDSVLRANMHI